MNDEERVELVVFLEEITETARIYQTAFRVIQKNNPGEEENFNRILHEAKLAPRTEEDSRRVERMIQLARGVHWDSQNQSAPA